MWLQVLVKIFTVICATLFYDIFAQVDQNQTKLESRLYNRAAVKICKVI